MALKKEHHTSEEIEAILKELSTQSDRGIGIIASAVIEELLAVVIQERLVSLNSETRQSLFERPNSPLSSFSAKIDLAYALGLYSPFAQKQLHTIRECRNKFAHRVESLTFNHPEIAEIIADLQADDFFKSAPTNKDSFLSAFKIHAAMLTSMCGENIRLKPLGEDRPDIFERLKALLFPPKGKGEETLSQPPKE